MKKANIIAAISLLVIISVLLGQKLQKAEILELSVQEIMQNVEQPDAQSRTPSLKEDYLAQHASQAHGHSTHSQDLEKHISNVRILMRMKYYEKIKIKSTERENFKKVFLTIATSPQASWLMQRQAIRNLQMHEISLSAEDQQKILKTADTRALAYLAYEDVEIATSVISQEDKELE